MRSNVQKKKNLLSGGCFLGMIDKFLVRVLSFDVHETWVQKHD